MNLDNYAGPFDVLLGMIANRRLALTEVSLSAITEEFLTYVRTLDIGRNMDEASAFLDVASVLIEAKSAALLPSDDNGARDERSMEALRERDLLFARLVQYHAFKQAACDFRVRMQGNACHPHPGITDPAFTAMLPQLVRTLSPQELARLAATALTNAPLEHVATHQLHVPLVDLHEQSALVRDRLRALPAGEGMAFAVLCKDAHSTLEVVARFFAVLVFFKQGAVQYRQSGPFEPLYVRWMPGRDTVELASQEDMA
ncbi:ScpA family protein [Bifidobacterium thermophilum]